MALQKKKNKEKSIVTQTAFRVSVVFLCALILLTVIFAIYIVRTMRVDILEEKEKQITTISETINSEIESLTSPVLTLGSYATTANLLQNRYEKYSQEWMRSIRNVDNYLQNVNMFYNDVIDILLIQPDSQVAYSLSDQMDVEYDYIQTPWFQDSLEQEGMLKYAYHSKADYYYAPGMRDTLSVIYPITREETMIGYVLYEYNLARIGEYFPQISDSQTGYLLINENGVPIFDCRPDREELDEFQAQMIAEKFRSEGNKFTYNNCVYLFSEVPACGWTVLSETDSRSIFMPIFQLVGVVIVILSGVVILLIAVSVYNAKKIKKPYDALIESIVSFDGSSAVAQYNYADAPKEIYTIATKFEEMGVKMNTLINDVYLAQLSRKEMELEAMINQINPHFLYNVFQLIQTEAVIADNYAIEDMIQKLSEMMRYTMERGREKVKIADEVVYITHYLEFYKERFENMFTYEIQCEDPEILECSTIKFILQPVVENCFKHGFKNTTSGGKVSVRICGTEKYVYFYIEDNGCGISPEKLLEIQEHLQEDITAKGIGIVNTNSRLRLVYGSSCGITFESRQGEYTKATIHIKREKEQIADV